MKPSGSEMFGTTIVRTDEYVLMAGVMKANDPNASANVVAAELSFLDDCLSMRRMFATYGKRKDNLFTPGGRLRKNSTYMDAINSRLDLLIKELNQNKIK